MSRRPGRNVSTSLSGAFLDTTGLPTAGCQWGLALLTASCQETSRSPRLRVMSEPWSVEGKRCVVTGATSGIGRATAVGLARAGARVAIVCRDPVRGAETVAEIHEQTGSDAVEVFLADLSSQDSIRHVARELLTRKAENFIPRIGRLTLRLDLAGYYASVTTNHEPSESTMVRFLVMIWNLANS